MPDIDDRLVVPNTPYEMLDGVLTPVAPAHPPHAERQAKLAGLLRAHVALAYKVACDQLIRTSEVDDFAPDISISPTAPDPVTGRRQIDQLVFEIVSTQSLSNAGAKAAKLMARGVRRVIAIHLKRARALDWSPTEARWLPITGSHLEDPVLDVPVPIEELITEAQSLTATARALLARREPVISEALDRNRAEGHAKGRAEGHAEGRAASRADAMRLALLALLRVRGIALDEPSDARIRAEGDPARLERWLTRAASCSSIDELLSEP